jgi:4-amino-4-deoxy-L-arabinose transferase-like glycosyltransferase
MAKTKPVPVKRAAPKQKQASASSFSFAKFADWTHIIIITLLFWIVYTNIFDKKPDMNGDNFAYYLLGKRLATGQGFTNATEIHHLPHTHFPPGYPFLLAGFMKTIGDDQDTLNFMNGLMMYGSLLLLYFMIKRLTASSALAFVATFITAINSHLLRSSTITMSEIPFLFISLLAIYTFIRAIDDPRSIKSIWLYVSILSVVICYHTKTTAVALIGGMSVYLLFARDWKRLGVVVAGFVLLCLPWHFRNSGLGDSHMGQLMQINPYKPELGNLTTSTFIDRISHNFIRYISTDIPSGVLSLEANFEKAPFSYWCLGILIIGLVLWGIFKLRDFRLMFLAYIGGTLAILLIWPDIWGGIRFILPLIPLAIFLALYGIRELIALAMPGRNISFVPYLFLIVGLLYVKPISALEEQADQAMPTNYTNYFDLAKWAKENTPKDAIFSARKPDMFIYYADRTCIGDKPSLDDKEVLDYFRQNKVDYVVVEQLGFSSTSKYLIPAIQKNPEKFQLIRQLPNPDTYLFKFKRD